MPKTASKVRQSTKDEKAGLVDTYILAAKFGKQNFWRIISTNRKLKQFETDLKNLTDQGTKIDAVKVSKMDGETGKVEEFDIGYKI